MWSGRRRVRACGRAGDRGACGHVMGLGQRVGEGGGRGTGFSYSWVGAGVQGLATTAGCCCRPQCGLPVMREWACWPPPLT